MALEEFRAYVEQVRGRTSLRSIIEDDTVFRADGFACCPLHKERTPSFHLIDEDRYHCFGCGANGDLFQYLIARDRISFREAVDKLAAKAGVTWEYGEAIFEEDDDLKGELRKMWDRSVVQDIHDRSARFMNAALPSQVRKWIREKYHFTDNLINERMIGWGTVTLYDYLTEDLEYTDEQLLMSGLFVRTKSGPVPFFDDRVVFPYYKGGHAVYFIGRKTPWTGDEDYEKGKYKKLLIHSERHPYVSPCVENHWFYNEDDTRGALDRLVITEGITDAISLSMAGQRNISPVTTRFSKKELERAADLCRNIGKVIICNDADESDDGKKPGLEGALSTARYLFDQGIHSFIAELPKPSGVRKLDLNEYLGKAFDEGGEDLARKKLEGVLSRAKPYVEWSIDAIPKNLSATELNVRLDQSFELVSKGEPIERARYAQQIAARFKLPKATISRQIENRARNEEREAAAEASAEDGEKKRTRNREDEAIKGRVFEDLGFYYTIMRDGSTEIISSFTVRPLRLVKYEEDRFLIDAVLRTENGTEYEHIFTSKAWRSKRDFLNELTHPALQWAGTDDNVQGILRLLKPEELRQHQGTKNLGFYKGDHGPRWVTRDVVFGPNGPTDENEITYVEGGAPLAERLRYEFPEHEEEKRIAAAALPALLNMNTARVMMPCIGWFFAAILKPLIEKEVGHFPILFVNGTQGSGKTTMLRDGLWPLLGVSRSRDPFSVTDTAFATIRNLACTDSIPIMFDEYKPGDMTTAHLDRIHRFIRRVYGGEIEVRGRADLSIEKYRLASPMVIAGESRPEGDPAILERILSVTPEKTSLTQARQDAFADLVKSEHWKLAGPIVMHLLGLDFEKVWAEAKVTTDELLARVDQKQRVPIRCYDNMRCMILGLMAFESYAAGIGIELPEMNYVEAFSDVMSAVLEGDDGMVKDAFDHFLESISTLAHLGLLESGKHFGIGENGRVFLHLAACHQVYLIERKKSGQPDGTNGTRALKQIAKEKLDAGGSYIISLNARHEVGNKAFRCIEIDQTKIPEKLDFNQMTAKAYSRNGYGSDDVQNDWASN